MTKRDALRKVATEQLEKALDAVLDLEDHVSKHPAKDEDTQFHYERVCNHAKDRADRAVRGLRDDFDPE